MLFPPVVRNKALAAGAARWLDELPGLIAGLEREWGITVGPPYPDATEAFVAEARPASVTTWAELDRPCSERAVEHALACAARRVAAHDDERAVLVHGDVHQWNVPEAPGELQHGAFKLVDPDGLLAEAEYDLGILMREDPVELRQGDPAERARWLARRCGLDATAIWEWGVVERVSTGLLATRIGLQPVGREMLATADLVAA
jgi:streptomycin 6-kinase